MISILILALLVGMAWTIHIAFKVATSHKPKKKFNVFQCDTKALRELTLKNQNTTKLSHVCSLVRPGSEEKPFLMR